MTTESKLIEDMARAICEAHGNNPDQNFAGLLGNRPRPAWMAYEHQAKAALAVAFPAIRERCAARLDHCKAAGWGHNAAIVRALSLDAPPAAGELDSPDFRALASGKVDADGKPWPAATHAKIATVAAPAPATGGEMETLIERLQAPVPQGTPLSVCRLLDEAAEALAAAKAPTP